MNSLLPSSQEFKEMLHLTSRRATWIFFALLIILLLGIGVVADRTTAAFAQSKYWDIDTEKSRGTLLKIEIPLPRTGFADTQSSDPPTLQTNSQSATRTDTITNRLFLATAIP